MTEHELFAYGTDEKVIKCPGKAAQYHLHTVLGNKYDIHPLGQAYDDQFDGDEGIVTEEEASEAMLAAVEQMREEGRDEMVEAGEAILDHLDWGT